MRSRAHLLLVAGGVGVIVLLVGRDLLAARIVGGFLLITLYAEQGRRLAHHYRRQRQGKFWIGPRTSLVLVAGCGAWHYANSPNDPVPIIASIVLLGVTVWYGRELPRMARVRDAPFVVNLPGAPSKRVPKYSVAYGWWSVSLLATLGVGGALGLVPLTEWALFGVSAAGVVIALYVGIPILRYARNRRQIRKALRDYRPVFAMPYLAWALFHVSMWSEQIRRSGPLIIVTTDPTTFERLGTFLTEPVVMPLSDRHRHLREALPRSLRVALYVHNSIGNRLFFRYRRMAHVFVHHGDGDKPASSSRRGSEYDVLVVAGQAAIDRYAQRGIKIPREKFVICGRPQTENILQVDGPVDPSKSSPSVLYAPTWRGGTEAANFSSLHLGAAIVRALLDRGTTVIFRPHPAGQIKDPIAAEAIATIKSMLESDASITGRQHVWGETAEREWALADAANRADAMVADVSGVVTDFMHSGKPFAMVATKSDTQDFRQKFPTSQGAYVIEGDLSTLDTALNDMLGPDTLRTTRLKRREYYLGGFVGGESARAFGDYIESLACRRSN